MEQEGDLFLQRWPKPFIHLGNDFLPSRSERCKSVSVESTFLSFLPLTFFFLLFCGTLQHQDSSVPLLQRLRGEWTPLTSGFRENDNATCRVPDWKFSPSLPSFFFLASLYFWDCFLIVKEPAEYSAPFTSLVPLSGFLCSVQ